MVGVLRAWGPAKAKQLYDCLRTQNSHMTVSLGLLVLCYGHGCGFGPLTCQKLFYFVCLGSTLVIGCELHFVAPRKWRLITLTTADQVW